MEDSKEASVPEDKRKTMTEKFRENPWVLSTVVLAVVTLVLLISNFSGGMTGGAIGVASKADVEQKVVDFVKLQTGETVNVVSSEMKNGLYEVVVSFQGQNVPLYVTADGQALVQGVLSFDEINQLSQDQQAVANQVIPVSVDDDPVKGNPASKVTIVEFSDFECPFCRKFFTETYPSIIKDYVNTGKAKIVFRDFPLISIHTKAQKASEAAQCAYEQGKFWEMHDKLFENQNSLDVSDLKKYAQELKLDTVKFNDCLDSGKMASEVQKDSADGQSYGVTGTPAFFINGRLISGAQPFANFKKIIDEELAKVSA
ncbi:MAG: DsbA family protein [Nanoarchaeota archaeon]